MHLLALLFSPALAADALILIPSDPLGETTALQAALVATGRLESVAWWDTSVATPTLGDLAAYDAVLLSSNLYHDDGDLLGLTLRRYVEQGGGLVEMQFNSEHVARGFVLGGLSAWFPIAGTADVLASGSMVGVAVDADSPLLVGIGAVSVPRYWDRGASLRPGAELVMETDAGTPLVAWWAPSWEGRVVSLAFFHGMDTAYGADGWSASLTDDDLLIAQALAFSSGLETDLRVTVSGSCPGPLDIRSSYGTPRGLHAVVSGSGPGATAIPTGNCAGTVLPLDRARLRAVRAADALGGFGLLPEILSPAACGWPFVIVDLQTCQVAEAALP